MKILMISTPYAGHVHPMLNVIESLAVQQHEVTCILSRKWQNEVECRGATLLPYKESNKLSSMLREAYFLGLDAGKDTDIIVYEQLFFLGKLLAENLHKPVVRLFATVAINKQVMENFIHSDGFMGIFRSSFIRHRWSKKVMRGISTSITDWTEEVTDNPPECNIVFVPHWFQPFPDDFPKEQYYFVGASVPQLAQDVTIPFEKMQHPIIYIALGTISNKNKSFYKKCFHAFGEENVSVILSLGNGLSADELPNAPDNFYIYSFVPQTTVLEHTNVFVTHCGMNSVNQAMQAGVPMVAIPFSNDQSTNAIQIEQLGLGIRLDKNRLKVDVLKRAVLTVLSDEDMKQELLKIQSEMPRIDGGKSALEIILDKYNNWITSS